MHDILMSGLDTLIAKSLELVVRDNLGQITFERIEKRLFEKYVISFSQAVEDFEKLDTVLREFFGGDADGVEKNLLDKIVAMREQKNHVKQWMTLEDARLMRMMLKSLGDEDKKNIINTVMGESKTISDILEISNIPQTSGYRKINSLIRDGVLLPHDHVKTSDGKKVTKYKAIFENVRISVEKNKIVMKILPTRESIDKSRIMQIMCS